MRPTLLKSSNVSLFVGTKNILYRTSVRISFFRYLSYLKSNLSSIFGDDDDDDYGTKIKYENT